MCELRQEGYTCKHMETKRVVMMARLGRISTHILTNGVVDLKPAANTGDQ